MEFTTVLKMQIKNKITAVLNVPGNMTRSSMRQEKVIEMMKKSSGNIKPIEIAIVLDMALEKDTLTDVTKQLAKCIKSHSELFRNVRVNLLYWIADDKIESGITALPMLMLGQVLPEPVFEETVCNNSAKKIEPLLEKLRKFYARTKIVFLVSDKSYQVEDSVYALRLLQPFLGKKMLSLTVNEEITCDRFSLSGQGTR